MLQCTELLRPLGLHELVIPAPPLALFEATLRDAHFGAIVEYLAADLLEMGKAAVDFWPLHMPGKETVQPNDQFDPSSIKRVYWKTRGGDGHKYCDPRGFGILTIVETIND